MPSLRERLAGCVVALAIGVGGLAPRSANAAPAATPPPAPAVDPSPRFPMNAASVEAAASALRRKSGHEETHREHTWRFKRDTDRKKPAQPAATWLVDMMTWLAESGRVIVWLIGATLLAVLLVTARRWLIVRAELADPRGLLPSHVRELDIRPQSLPDDIGGAVRELWLSGKRRAALSLLYRGALSRLVHSHGVAIDAASTEGDCVRLARAALRPEQGSFVQMLVQVWQLAIYGNRGVESARVLQLCDEFDRMLPKTIAVQGPA